MILSNHNGFKSLPHTFKLRQRNLNTCYLEVLDILDLTLGDTWTAGVGTVHRPSSRTVTACGATRGPITPV